MAEVAVRANTSAVTAIPISKPSDRLAAAIPAMISARPRYQVGKMEPGSPQTPGFRCWSAAAVRSATAKPVSDSGIDHRNECGRGDIADLSSSGTGFGSTR